MLLCDQIAEWYFVSTAPQSHRDPHIRRSLAKCSNIYCKNAVKIHIYINFNAQSYATHGRGGVCSEIRAQHHQKCVEKQMEKTMKSSQANFVNGRGRRAKTRLQQQQQQQNEKRK